MLLMKVLFSKHNQFRYYQVFIFFNLFRFMLVFCRVGIKISHFDVRVKHRKVKSTKWRQPHPQVMGWLMGKITN